MHQLILNQSECNLMQRSNSHQANLHQLTELLTLFHKVCLYSITNMWPQPAPVCQVKEKDQAWKTLKFQFACLRSKFNLNWHSVQSMPLTELTWYTYLQNELTRAWIAKNNHKVSWRMTSSLLLKRCWNRGRPRDKCSANATIHIRRSRFVPGAKVVYMLEASDQLIWHSVAVIG